LATFDRGRQIFQGVEQPTGHADDCADTQQDGVND
jgi:hypothetical protein